MSNFLNRLVEKNSRGTHGLAVKGLRPRPLSRFEPGESGLTEPARSGSDRSGPAEARTGLGMAGEQTMVPAGQMEARAPFPPALSTGRAGEARKVWEDEASFTPASTLGLRGGAGRKGEARKVWENDEPLSPALSPTVRGSAGGTPLNPIHSTEGSGEAGGTPFIPNHSAMVRGGSEGTLLPQSGRRGRWGRQAFPEESSRGEFREPSEGWVFHPAVHEPLADRTVLQPVMKPAVPSAPQAASPATGTTGGSNATASSAPAAPTIHVSIGRLEVRASVPAKSPARPVQSPTRPASLQEYLERKKGTR